MQGYDLARKGDPEAALATADRVFETHLSHAALSRRISRAASDAGLIDAGASFTSSARIARRFAQRDRLALTFACRKSKSSSNRATSAATSARER